MTQHHLMPVQLRRLLSLSSALLVFTAVALHSTTAAEEERAWQAQWITPTEDPAGSPGTWLAFRGVWTLDTTPSHAPTRIAVDSKYWLWINGMLVVREGGLKRGPRPGATYHDSIDLARYLRVGSNTVAVLVWHFGRDGFSHVDSGRAGLVIESRPDRGPVLGTDASWRVQRHPAFGTTGEPHPNFRLSESNVHFDARLDQPEWILPDFAVEGWPTAIAAGTPPAAPWGELVARPIPFWRDYGLRGYDAFQRHPPRPDDDGVIRARLPYNAHVHPTFTIAAPAGLTIDVRTDHYLGGGPPNVRTEYVTRDGVQHFECPAWMNGHTVEYRFPPGVTVLDLGYRETGYDADFAGHFGCDDPLLNHLWQESARTLYVTLRDNYMDCPDRERAQWWGDVVIELGQTFYALDRRVDGLTTKAIRELVAWQRPDGTLYSPIPAGNWDKELPTQMLASVGHYGFWTYVFEKGDRALAAEVYSAVSRYLAVWSVDADGLVIPRAGGWTWGDWGEQIDLGLLYQGWYALAMRGQRQLAEMLGKAADAAEIGHRMERQRSGFNARFWTGSAYRSSDYEGPPDDRGNGLAVVAGLAPASHYPAVRAVLRTRRQSSPYMEKYVLEALLQMGFVEDALHRMRERYAPMLRDDFTTLYEGWGIGAEGFGGGTINHAWSGGPLTLLSRYVAGVAPLAPGYTRFEVAPRLGPLRSAAVVVPSPAGEITASTRREGNDLVIDLTVPVGAIAIVPRPAETHRVAIGGSSAKEAPPTLSLESGSWTLRFTP